MGRGGTVACGVVDEVAVELRTGISHGSYAGREGILVQSEPGAIIVVLLARYVMFLSLISHSSGVWSSAGGGAGSLRSAGAGVVGGPGGSFDVFSCGSPMMRWLAEALTGQDNRLSLAQNVVGFAGRRTVQVEVPWVASGLEGRVVSMLQMIRV